MQRIPKGSFLAGLAALLVIISGSLLLTQGFIRQPGPAPVHSPVVLYLSPSQAPELWRVSENGEDPLQLTNTGGKVYDYGISSSDGKVIYAVKNARGGIDLWELEARAGSPGKPGSPGEPRMLLPCGTDWCINPAYSPDGSRIAYSRRQASGIAGSQPGAARIWLLDRASGSTQPQIDDPNIGGGDPAWSPNGRYLAFYDGLSGAVRVQDVTAANAAAASATSAGSSVPAAPAAAAASGFELAAEEGTGLAWQPDSQHLFYTRMEITSEVPHNAIYVVDVQTRKAAPLLGEEAGSGDAADPVEYSVLACSPDGKSAVFGRRPAGSSAGKQLWLFNLGENPKEKSAFRQLTNDELFTNAAYHWGPGGQKLVFQRIALGQPGSEPQIVIWDRQDQKSFLLAEDAFQPGWLP